MKNPYASPDPHAMAHAVVAMARQIGATVIGWSHVIDGTRQELKVETSHGTVRYDWDAKRGDWVRSESQATA